jgi:Zn-dependent protease/CBS domain-containing protein
MRDSLQLGTIRGIHLRVHFTFPLIFIWVILQFGVLTGQGVSGALFGVVVMLILFGIVVLHELGHSIAAQHYGVPVDEIVLLPIGGVAKLKRIPENPVQELVIAIAGPAVNFAIAIVLIVLNALLGLSGRIDDPAALLTAIETLSPEAIFYYVFVANLFLAIFNLLPAFPMDGGRVLRALLATRLPYPTATSIAVTIGQILAWVMGLWGFLGGGFFLIIIAIFIYLGASQEGQMVQVRSVLGDLIVRQAYSRQVQKLSPTSTLGDAVQFVLTTFQADFPVCDGERLVGLVTYKRLVEALNQHGPEMTVEQIMITDVTPVSPTDALAAVQQRMLEENADALPVVEGDRFLGLLTSRDVSEVFRLASIQPDLIPPSEAMTIPDRT